MSTVSSYLKTSSTNADNVLIIPLLSVCVYGRTYKSDCWGANETRLHDRERRHPKFSDRALATTSTNAITRDDDDEADSDEDGPLLAETNSRRQVDLTDLGAYEDEPRWMRHRRTEEEELEDVFDADDAGAYGSQHTGSWKCFDEWNLQRGGGLLDRLTGSTFATYGVIKGLIRIVPPATPTAEMLKARIVTRPIEFRVSEKELTKTAPTPVVVRLYAIRGNRLETNDFNGRADAFLKVTLEGLPPQEKGRGSTASNSNPYFGDCYEFPSVMPGPSQLHIDVCDKNTVASVFGLGLHDMIGSTTIDLEVLCAHLEHRPAHSEHRHELLSFHCSRSSHYPLDRFSLQGPILLSEVARAGHGDSQRDRRRDFDLVVQACRTEEVVPQGLRQGDKGLD